VKLTQRGKDLLKASLIGGIAAAILDVRIFIALCLSLVVCAALSEITVALTSTRNIEIIFENTHISCFKGSQAQETVRVVSKRSRLVTVTVSEIRAPDGVEAIIDREDPDSTVFLFRPNYAGRFVGLSARLELRDPLGLFSKSIIIERNDFVIDCYPSSLLKEIQASRPVTLSLGERMGRTRGGGQEFHSIEEYQGSVERKNIFWKKIAAMPDERLLVKVRESNIPKALSIGLVRGTQRQDDLRWFDLACEAAALLGKMILEIGCDVVILFSSGDNIERFYITQLSDLAGAIMEMSTASESSIDFVSELLAESDVFITGLKEIEVDLIASSVAKKPAVLIEDYDAFPRIIGTTAIVFNGDQDVSGLVTRIVGR